MRALASIALALLGGIALATAPEPARVPLGETPPEARARRFTQLFLEGDDEGCQRLMDESMKLQFPRERAEITRQMLLAQHGDLRSVGEAWHEDDMAGYRRYRVPVRYAGLQVDFRVVLDRDLLVAGFFVVSHAEPPDPDEGPPGSVVATLNARRSIRARLSDCRASQEILVNWRLTSF